VRIYCLLVLICFRTQLANFFHVPVDLPETPVAVVSGEGVSDVLTSTVAGLSILCMTFWKPSPYFVVLDRNTPHCFESMLAS
jgi:hypothetical protein